MPISACLFLDERSRPRAFASLRPHARGPADLAACVWCHVRSISRAYFSTPLALSPCLTQLVAQRRCDHTEQIRPLHAAATAGLDVQMSTRACFLIGPLSSFCMAALVAALPSAFLRPARLVTSLSSIMLYWSRSELDILRGASPCSSLSFPLPKLLPPCSVVPLLL